MPCTFKEKGSSSCPSRNGEGLHNVTAVPLGLGKWIQVNIRGHAGVTAYSSQGWWEEHQLLKAIIVPTTHVRLSG